MAVVVAFAVGLLALVLDIAATRAVLRYDGLSALQRAAWLSLVWLAPLVGAMFALQLTSEGSAHLEPGPQIEMPLGGGDEAVDHGGASHHADS